MYHLKLLYVVYFSIDLFRIDYGVTYAVAYDFVEPRNSVSLRILLCQLGLKAFSSLGFDQTSFLFGSSFNLFP